MGVPTEEWIYVLIRYAPDARLGAIIGLVTLQPGGHLEIILSRRVFELDDGVRVFHLARAFAVRLRLARPQSLADLRVFSAREDTVMRLSLPREAKSPPT